MLRLRTILFVCFTVVSAIPVGLLAWWVAESALEQEYKAVEEKHLLVAKNLTNALSRYATDAKEVFLLAERFILQGETHPSTELTTLFESLHLWRICRVSDTGTDVYFNVPAISQGQGLTERQLKTASEYAHPDKVVFLPVMSGSTGKPVLTLVHQLSDGSIVIGEMDTTYIRETQKAITFGEKGHAAIVDQDGNVLAHPKPTWVKTHKNISKIAPVKAMMNRQQGVSFFYSPAIKADMVAGYSFVPETGWGAMIPQPVSELKVHAAKTIEVAITIAVAGTLAALVLAWLLAGLIANPANQVARTARAISQNKSNIDAIPAPSPSSKELSDLVVSFNNMVNEVTSKTKELRHLANHDPLTELPNRTRLKAHLTRRIQEIKTQGGEFTLLFLDLDQFKEVNDNLGHNFGDRMLKEVAHRLKSEVGDLGMVSRLGGDEFAIVLNPTKVLTLAEEVSKRLVDCISKSYVIDDEEVIIGTSIGIAYCPKDSGDIDGLLRCADLAMYAAKADPSRNYQSYTAELHQSLHARKVLEHDLRLALKKEEFTLHYQPRIDPTTGQIRSLEALVRWNHPKGYLVYPGDFIPATERSGDIIPLGEWVMQQACRDHSEWVKQGLGNILISINLSERQFHIKNLVERVKWIFEQENANPEYFEFEITESLALYQPARVTKVLEGLHELGFKISIDDFGTGYSSLERLRQLPIDKIKIDQSFVQEAGCSDKDSAIVLHMLNLAKGLDLGVVAEGVELPRQLDFLKNQGCNEVQGFIYTRALPQHEVTELVKNQPLLPHDITQPQTA